MGVLASVWGSEFPTGIPQVAIDDRNILIQGNLWNWWHSLHKCGLGMNILVLRRYATCPCKATGDQVKVINSISEPGPQVSLKALSLHCRLPQCKVSHSNCPFMILKSLKLVIEIVVSNSRKFNISLRTRTKSQKGHIDDVYRWC
jgi:hypothetical protein